MATTDNVDERLRELLSPLEAEEGRLLVEKEELSTRLGEVTAALNRVRRVRTAAFPAPPSPRIKRNPPGGYVSEEKLALVVDFLQKATEPMSVGDTARALKVSEPTITKAFSTLREQQKIRLAGKNNKNAKVYVMMETDGS